MDGSRNKSKVVEGRILRYIGEVLLNIDHQHLSEAENWIKKAIKADERNGVMLHLAMDYALYAKLVRRKGDQEKAKKIWARPLKSSRNAGLMVGWRNMKWNWRYLYKIALKSFPHNILWFKRQPRDYRYLLYMTGF